MSGENKKTGTDNKIMSFQISEEEMQDPKLDSYVRESLIREADELEEKLNRRSDLAEVKAPEGMYSSIVEELKARGAWKEDGAGEDAQTLEALYAQLPEEDRKALALGRELARKKEAKAGKRRRRRKIFKLAGIAAACLCLVFGASMTSDANRRLVQRMWDGVMIDFGFRVDTDNMGEGESIRSKSVEEIAAMEKISKRLGSPTIDFLYLPKGMKYEGYEITNEFEAAVFYSYKDTLFYLTILNMDKEGTHYYKYDTEAFYRKTVETQDEIEAKIWEVNLDISTETYIAEIDYTGWRFVLNGMMPLEEMEKIVQLILIL